MPWNLLLTTLLPIILAPSHPHAEEAHKVLADATAISLAARTSSPLPADHHERLSDVLKRSLDLSLKARALVGNPGDATTDALAAALAGLLAPRP